jgi:hypothetical protein
MFRFSIWLPLALALVLTACLPGSPGSGLQPTAIEMTAVVETVDPVIITDLPPDFTPPPTPLEPTQTPIPTLSGGLSPTELKFRVLEQYPDLFFCDPDYYPVANADEMVLALQRFPGIQANAEELEAILAHTNLVGRSDFTDDQKLLIYRAHKRLRAIPFELAGEAYRFQIQVAKTEGEGQPITGLIDAEGSITEIERIPSIAACPICLAAGTMIDTPAGPLPVQELRPGMPVWTMDAAGERVARPLISVGKTVVPASHQVVHLQLEDGREAWISPGHPTADGRSVGQLKAGDRLDGSRILSVQRVHYTGSATYDLLPAGETGVYWANGILLASSLDLPAVH